MPALLSAERNARVGETIPLALASLQRRASFVAAAARPPSSRAHAPASTSLQLDTSRSGRHAVASARGRVVGRVARASPATTYFLATEPAKKAPRAAAPLPDAMLRELQSRTAAMGGPRLEAGDAALRSTPKQRLVVALWAALELALAGRVAGDVSSPEGALCVAASLVAAFFAADLGSGLFHWATDNYGDKRTPVLGGVIDAFQGHHRFPRTITQREFANNVSNLCSTQLTVVSLALAAPLPPPLRAFAGAFLFLTAMSQQTHAWAHARRAELPPLVRAAQDAGLLISTRSHAAHHRPPFSGNYSIVSGATNGVLDSGLTRALERAVYAATGVAPRSWLPELEAAWAEAGDDAAEAA